MDSGIQEFLFWIATFSADLCTHRHFSTGLALNRDSPSSDAVENTGQQQLWKRLGNDPPGYLHRDIPRAGWSPRCGTRLTFLCTDLRHFNGQVLTSRIPSRHPAGVRSSLMPFPYPRISFSAFLIPGDWTHPLNVAALFSTYRKEFYTPDSMHTTDTAA